MVGLKPEFALLKYWTNKKSLQADPYFAQREAGEIPRAHKRRIAEEILAK